MSTSQPTVIFIDDEERILRSLRMLFRGRCELLATTDPQQVLDWVRQRRVHVVVSDQRMPLMRGVDLLRSVKEQSPNTMRILLTGYSELDAVVASVNEGEVFRFVSKPWDPTALLSTVQSAAGISQQLFSAADLQVLTATPRVQQSVGVLVLDRDPGEVSLVRDVIQQDLGLDAPVYWATTLEEALQALAESGIGVLVSDIRLDGEDITGAIKGLKQRYPELVTVVVTPHRDTGVLIELINQGQVYRFLPKPASRTLLGRNVASALAYHRTLCASPELTRSHAVEPVRKPEELKLLARLRGVFDRIRGTAQLQSLTEATDTP